MTLQGWARVNNESYGSFRHFLGERWGTRATNQSKFKPGKVSARIFDKLVKQGLLDK